MRTGSSGDTSGCRTCVGGEVALAASGAGAVGSAAVGVQRRWIPKGSETSIETLESWNGSDLTLHQVQEGLLGQTRLSVNFKLR